MKKIIYIIAFNLFAIFLTGQDTYAAVNKTSVDNRLVKEKVNSQPHYAEGIASLNSFFKRHLKYPDRAIEYDIRGKVGLKVFLDSQGEVTKVIVDKPLFADLNKEARRVALLMPDWVPAYQNSHPVPCVVPIEVVFD